MKFNKFTIIYFFFGILGIGAFLSFSSNPPNAHTGAPGDEACTECHQPGNPLGLDGEFSLSGFPTSINPGETYSVSVVVRNNNGLAQRNGFQAVILDEAANNIGDITTSGANPTTETAANGREYVEHNPAIDFANNEVNWTFSWTAPEDAVIGEEITLYVGSIVGSGTAGNSNDLFISDNFTGTVEEAVSTNDLETVAKIDVFPNPTTDFFTLQLEGEASENVDVRLITPTGQSVYAQTDLSLNSTTEIPVTNLSAGIYFLQVNSETATTTRRVVVE